VTTFPDEDGGGPSLPGAERRTQGLAAAIAVAGGFAAVALSWELAGALAGFALFLLWSAKREARERAIDLAAPGRWYVGAGRELEIVGTDAHQAELARARRRHGRDWIPAVLRPLPSGEVALEVDGTTIGRLAERAAIRYRAREGDAVTAVAIGLVERDGRVAVAFA
jgi:hypothetical protein